MNEAAFEKIEACGNDFLLLRVFPGHESVIALCDRHHGVGADGLMILNDVREQRVVLDHYDADGSRSFCLNGIHAALRYLAANDEAPAAGTVASEGVELGFRMDGRAPRLFLDKRPCREMVWRDEDSGESRHGYFADVGNPQFVIFQTLSIDEFRQLAPRIRSDRRAFPEGVNVNMAYPVADHWRIHSFERGVEDFTLACGTGMYAAALALFANRGLREARFAPDGKGRVALFDRGDCLEMESTARWVASGVWRCG